MHKRDTKGQFVEVKPIKTGDKFGRLTAVKSCYKDGHLHWLWLFRCDCGKEKIVVKGEKGINRMGINECVICDANRKIHPFQDKKKFTDLL